MKKLNFIFCIMSLFYFSSCAAFKPKLDKERAANIKKVVILSMEIQQKQPKDALGLSQLGEKAARRSDSEELKKMAKEIYQYLAKKIENDTPWKVVSYNKITSAGPYSQLFRQKMTGIRTVSFTSENTELIFPEGVIDNSAYGRMSFADKVKYAKSLGADAFAVYIAYQTIEQGISFGNIVGEAEFSFNTRSNLLVYGFDSEEPIWRVQNIDGESSRKSGELKKDYTKLEMLGMLGKESAQSSIDKMVQYYKTL